MFLLIRVDITTYKGSSYKESDKPLDLTSNLQEMQRTKKSVNETVSIQSEKSGMWKNLQDKLFIFFNKQIIGWGQKRGGKENCD